MYRNSLYYDVPRSRSDGVGEQTNNANPFYDVYANTSYSPSRPLRQNWTYIRSEVRPFRFFDDPQPFVLFLDELEAAVGQRRGVQVRLEAEMTEYFYNDTQAAFAETRVIGRAVALKFLGGGSGGFKPGMPYFGQVAVSFEDLVPLGGDVLSASSLVIEPVALTANGGTRRLNPISVPSE